MVKEMELFKVILNQSSIVLERYDKTCQNSMEQPY